MKAMDACQISERFDHEMTPNLPASRQEPNTRLLTVSVATSDFWYQFLLCRTAFYKMADEMLEHFKS